MTIREQKLKEEMSRMSQSRRQNQRVHRRERSLAESDIVKLLKTEEVMTTVSTTQTEESYRM